MLEPGATNIGKAHVLEKLEITSDFVVEPTTVAFLTHPGAPIFVRLPSFPAAITTDIFSAICYMF